MAGPGRVADPSSSTQTKNRHGWVRLSSSARVDVVPPLPSRPAPRAKWLEETREVWRLWWSAPVATLWTDELLPTLWTAIRMVDRLGREPGNTRLAAELRQIRAELLLTRKAQLAAHVLVVETGEDKPPVEDVGDADAPRPRPDVDPRMRLVR